MRCWRPTAKPSSRFYATCWQSSEALPDKVFRTSCPDNSPRVLGELCGPARVVAEVSACSKAFSKFRQTCEQLHNAAVQQLFNMFATSSELSQKAWNSRQTIPMTPGGPPSSPNALVELSGHLCRNALSGTASQLNFVTTAPLEKPTMVETTKLPESRGKLFAMRSPRVTPGDPGYRRKCA